MHGGRLTHPEQKMTAVKSELQCDRGKKNGQQTYDCMTFPFRFLKPKSKIVMKHHLFMKDSFSAGVTVEESLTDRSTHWHQSGRGENMTKTFLIFLSYNITCV